MSVNEVLTQPVPAAAAGAVAPQPSGAVPPASGATAAPASQQAPTTTTPPAPVQDPLPAPMRALVEETLKVEKERLRREVQSEKDKAIAEIKRSFGVQPATATQPAATPAPQPATPSDGLLTPEEEKHFVTLADQDFAGAMRFRDNLLAQRSVERAVQAVRAEQQQVAEQYRAAQQYEAAFETLCTNIGATPEERGRAIQAVQESFNRGQPITPFESLMIGRFGSLEQATAFAAQGLRQAVPSGTPAPQIPGQPTPPSLPGGSRGTAPTQQTQGQPIGGAGTFRQIFRA